MQTVELPNGLQVCALNKGEASVLYHEIFVEQAYSKHGITVSDGACVFDIGANIGWFTMTAALAAGDLPSAIESAESAMRDDPLDEDACRALMRAYEQSGLPASALAAIGSLAIAGIAAGLYPARKAALLPPVEALRQE